MCKTKVGEEFVYFKPLDPSKFLFLLTFVGRVIGIVIAAGGASAVLIVGAAVGVYTWKNRIIQKKREGKMIK